MQLRQRPHLGWMGSSPSSPLLLRAAGLVRSSDFVWLLCVHVPWLPGRRWPVVADANQRRGRWAPEKNLVRLPGGGATTGFAVRSAPCIIRRNESTAAHPKHPRAAGNVTAWNRGKNPLPQQTRSLVIHTPLRISLVSVYALRGSHIGYRGRLSRTRTTRGIPRGGPARPAAVFQNTSATWLRRYGECQTANALLASRQSGSDRKRAIGRGSTTGTAREPRGRAEPRTPGAGCLAPDLPVQVCTGPPLAVTLQVPIATSE